MTSRRETGATRTPSSYGWARTPTQIALAFGILATLNAPCWAAAEVPNCAARVTKHAGMGVAWEVGPFRFHTNTPVDSPDQYDTAWEHVVHKFVEKFERTCVTHRNGNLSDDVYDGVMARMDRLYEEAQALEEQVVQGRTDAGKAMEAGTSLLDALEQLTRRIDELDETSRGRPGFLEPKKPCSPPDMLGAPGRSC